MSEPDASSTVKGITKLSIDPVSSTNPIAVGNNDARVNEYNAAAYSTFSDAVDAVAALSGTNKLVISTPVTVSSSKTVPADVILEFVNAGMLTITSGTVEVLGEIRARADKVFDLSGGALDIDQAKFDECYFEWFGAVSNVDNTTAIQTLINARKSAYSTRVRMLPGTVYSFASPISFSESRGFSLTGGGSSEYNPTSELRYTGSGSLSAIAFRSTYGFVAESVKFSYTSSSFTGYLIDSDWSDSPGDSTYNHFRNCQFTGTDTAYDALALVSANRSIIWTFEQCLFFNAQVGISGARNNLNATISSVSVPADTLTVTGHGLRTGDIISFTTTGSLPGHLLTGTSYNAIVIDANTIKVATSRSDAEAGAAMNLTSSGSGTNKVVAGGYSYVIKLDSNTFVNLGVAIYNPDQCWTIINNTFEPTRNDMSGGILTNELRVIDGQTGRFMWNMVFSGNWMGDVGSTANDYSVVHLQGSLGAVISGNLFYGNGSTGGHKTTAIDMSGCQGVLIQGNRIEGWNQAFAYSSTYNYGITYQSNDLQCSVNAPVSGGGSGGIQEVRLANTNLTGRISYGLEVAGSSGTTAISSANTIMLGSLVTGSIDTGVGAGIRSAFSISGYQDGSLIVQPRTDIATDVGFHTASGEQFRVTDSGVKVGQGTAIAKVLRGSVSFNPSSVAANSVSTQTLTVSGVATGDSVALNPPSGGLTAGLLVAQVRVSAADTLSVTLFNTTGSAIDEGSGIWNYLVVR